MTTYLLTGCSTDNKSKFLQQIDATKLCIQHVFRDLIERVKQREVTLLQQLDDMKREYELNNKETQGTLNTLKAQRDFTLQNLKSNELKELQLNQLGQLNRMISELELNDEERSVNWILDDQQVQAISTIGKLEVSSEVKDQVPIQTDYKQKVKPIISKCRHGNNEDELVTPWSVAVDLNTGNIFIVDNGNRSIKVFTSNGDFIFMFSANDILNSPRNICIYKEKLFVTHNHGVVVFNRDGHLLHTFGTEGSNHDQFNNPHGITICPLNNDIYICDHDNLRIQIYESNNFKFKTTFGKDSLKFPIDIKYAQNKFYILGLGSPCLHIYNTEHMYIRSIISLGSDTRISFSLSFHIDNNYNICITDVKRHCLYVFTNSGELFHQIGNEKSADFQQPRGVAIDKKGRIIIVNDMLNAKLLIF